MPKPFFSSIESLSEAIQRVRSLLDMDGHVSTGSLPVMVNVTREGFYLYRVPGSGKSDCGCSSSSSGLPEGGSS